jgi:hypothetical protein
MPAALGGLHDRIADGKAEPGAAALAGPTAESLEDARAALTRNARPGIADSQTHVVAVADHGDAHVSTRRRIAAGIVEEHADEPVDPLRRRVDRSAYRPVGAIVEVQLCAVGNRDEPLRAHVGGGDQVDRLR